MLTRLITILTTAIMVLTASGCAYNYDYRCRAWDHCPSQGDIQYIKIPNGYGGKYCRNDPRAC